MKIEHKKLIAREGLIILAILFISGVLMLSSNWFRDQERELTTSVDQRLEAIEIPDTMPRDEARKKYSKEVAALHAAVDKANRYSNYEKFAESSSLAIFFFVYPFLLILRFIMWASAILKVST